MSRDTTTGLKFEKRAMVNRTDGLNWSKRSFCSKFKEYFKIDPNNYLSWSFQPDEAYYLPETNELIIYEKKTQNMGGSADNKLPACGWWYSEYKRLADAAGISKVSYIFILDFATFVTGSLSRSNESKALFYVSVFSWALPTPTRNSVSRLPNPTGVY